ncbi:MAG TPA: MliC family protein [Synergistales bacterium]|jgi:putative lipoprotein|nr:MliC family protein [Synergistales bacterium]HRV70874.1 MliC family protein [Thermovirgaceae bacterium]
MRKKAILALAVLMTLIFVVPDSISADTSGVARFSYDFFGLRFDVEFVDDAAVLYLPSGPLKLPQVISGSGARYSDGETTFWIKGDDAYMEINGSVAEEAD